METHRQYPGVGFSNITLSWAAFALVLACSLVAQGTARAEPGDVNPWFGGQGYAGLYPDPVDGRAGGMFVQPDGKILLGGGSWNFLGYRDFFVVRYQANGKLDRYFRTEIRHGESFVNAVTMQADWRILAAGYSGTDNTSVALVRYLSDGSPDLSFGPNHSGIVLWDSPVNDRATCVALSSDGKILVGGGTLHFLLLRYNFDGTLDPSFGGAFGVPGQALALFGPPSLANAMALYPDGRIILAGYVEFAPGQRRVALARFLSNGMLDPTFAGVGIATFPLGQSNGEASALVIQEDGKILVGGTTGTGSGRDFLLLRLSQIGSLDPTFGTGGVVSTDMGGVNGDACVSLAVQPDRKIVAAGYQITDGGYTADPDRWLALARYTDRGVLDTEFGGSGKVTPAWSRAAVGVSLRSDGTLLVGDQDCSVVAYVGQGAPEIALETWGQPLTNGVSQVVLGAEVGGFSDYEAVVIRNVGTRALSGLAVSVDGPNAAEFSVQGPFSYSGLVAGPDVTSVPMAASAKLTIRFSPTATGTRTATLHIASNDADENPFNLKLSGESRAPLRWVSPLLLPCGTVGADFYFPLVASGSWPPYNWYASGAGDWLHINRQTGLLTGRPTVPMQTSLSVSAAVGMFEQASATLDLRVLGAMDPGAQDLGFGAEGKFTTSVGASHDRVEGMALQPDGKILVVGGALYNGQYDMAIVRCLPDGTLDGTFGAGGKILTRIGSNQDFARGVAVQRDGGIVVAGDSYNGRDGDIAVVRYLRNGALDSSFGTAGKLTFTVSSTSSEMGRAVALQSDGKIVVAGQSDHGTVRTAFAVFRFHQDGSPDRTFGGQGWVTTAIGTGNASGYTVALQRDGKILVGGSRAGASGDADFALVRYLPDGRLDAGFGNQGIVVTPLGSGDDLGQSLKIQGDGRLLLAGYCVEPGTGNCAFALARFLANGILDPAFGAGGKVVTSFAAGTDAQGRGVALQADGRIVVAGDYFNGINYDFALARYLPNGALDPTFGNSGKLITLVSGSSVSGGGTNDLGRCVVVQPDGKIVVAGDSHNGANYDFAVVRYLGATDPVIAVSDCDGNELTDGGAFVDFGKIQTTWSPGCELTVRNSGAATLTGLAIRLDGPNAGDFSVSAPATQQLGSGQSTTIHIILIPKAVGSRTATLHVTSNEAQENPFDIVLSGTVVGPTIVTSGPLPSGRVGEPYAFAFEATGGTPPYAWKALSGLPIGVVLSHEGLLSGTPVSAATHDLIVTATGADGARSSITALSLAILPALHPSDLDPTFGDGGKVVTDVGGADDFGSSVVVQRDGRILVAGYSSINNREQFALARYLPDGSPDATFGKEGKVTTDFPLTRAFGRSVALQSDGRILVAGEYSKGGSFKFALARYRTDGSLDPMFGEGGIMTNLVGNGSVGKAVLVQSDGGIVVAGRVDMPGVDFGAARWLPNGALDPSFGLRGVVTADFGLNPNFDYAQAAALQADDRFVVVGYTTGANFGLVRFERNGTLDPTFGQGGVVTTSFGNTSDFARSIVVQADGRMVVAGEVGRDFGLARYLGDGSLDPSFGTGGKVTTVIDRYEAFPRGVAVQENGAIVVAGYTSNGQDMDFAVARYNSGGALDATFSGDGKVLTSVGPGHDRARSVAIQNDGNIVVAGEAYNGRNYDFALVRYLGTPKPEIVVEQPAGTDLADGGRGVRFGAAVPGGAAVFRTFTVRNAGTARLTGLAITKDGANASDFGVERLPATSLAAGASVRFDVAFRPGAAGSRTAAIHIASNDADESPFDIVLRGSGGSPFTPLEAWRLAYFGSTDNAGDGADAFDFDGDGLVNLWEYASGSNPRVLEGTSSRPAAVFVEGRIVFTFLCDARCTDILYAVQATSSLGSDAWTDIALSTGGSQVEPKGSLCEVIDSGAGVRQVFITPAATLFPSGYGFLRVQVGGRWD